jgi:hypothetical protein
MEEFQRFNNIAAKTAVHNLSLFVTAEPQKAGPLKLFQIFDDLLGPQNEADLYDGMAS